MNIPAPDTTIGQLKLTDKMYSTEMLSSTLSAAASKPTNPIANNLVKTTAEGELQDAGYHFEVRNGIPCIVQYT